MRPIDGDAFKKILQNEYIRDDADGNSNYLVKCIIERLDEMPTLKAEIVSEEPLKTKQKHTSEQQLKLACHWFPQRRNDLYGYYKCTNCGEEIQIYCEDSDVLPSKCPGCHSIMEN